MAKSFIADMRYIDAEIEHIRSYTGEITENKSQPSIETTTLASSGLIIKEEIIFEDDPDFIEIGNTVPEHGNSKGYF